MVKALQTARQLYFGLVLSSALCVITIYFVVGHYHCCQYQEIRDVHQHLSPVPGSLRVIVNRIEEEQNELQRYLMKFIQATIILIVNLVTVGNSLDKKTTGKNLVYTFEKFPNHNETESGVRNQEVGKVESRKTRGFFCSFSFTGDRLSAATRQLFRLNALAKYGKRLVVEPLVKDTLFYGDELSSKHPPLSPSSLYYNINSVNELLERYGYARFASRRVFLEKCRGGTGTLYVRLFPNAWQQSRIKLKPEMKSLINQTAKRGWMRCQLPILHLQYYALMKELRISQQVCVISDTVRNFSKLEDQLLQRYKCVVFHHWSGTGERKGNYFMPLTTKLPPLQLTHLLPFSSQIVGKARRFATNVLGSQPYIPVHIRTERFFRTNPSFTENFSRFQMCSEFLVKLVSCFKETWKVSQVFLATDLGERGSSAIAPILERVSVLDRATINKLMINLVEYQDDLTQRLQPVVRAVSEGVDKGVEALVDMSILKDADHLVTVGTGLTLQLWLIDLFRRRQEEKGKSLHSVVKLC